MTLSPNTKFVLAVMLVLAAGTAALWLALRRPVVVPPTVPLSAVNALEAVEVAETDAAQREVAAEFNAIVTTADADARSRALFELRRRRGRMP